MGNTVVPATTAATTYDFTLSDGEKATIAANGLAGVETIDLQVQLGTSFVNSFYTDGTQIQITITANPLTVDSPGDYRLNKGITAGPTSTHVIQKINP